MPQPDLLFQRLLKELRHPLAEYGFRRQSQTFVIESPQCWGVINFQKTRYSVAEEKTFTINVAIAAKRILHFDGEPTDRPPPHYACHWETRIGQLIPGHGDRWWRLSNETSYESAVAEVKQLIAEKAVPVIKEHLTEEGLLELWGKILGGPEYPILKDKSILLAERGKFNELSPIFERIREICRGGLAEPGAERFIARVKERFCLQVR